MALGEVAEEVAQLSSLDEVSIGTELHRSNGNVCYHATYRGAAVVVKRLIVSSANCLSNFEAEVAILCRPELAAFLVTPLAVVRAAPHYSIVLPLMEHGSLSTLMRSSELPLGLVLCFALDQARALEAFHRSGYVHRDVKAANTLVGGDWLAKLTDLGSVALAAAVTADGDIVRGDADTASMMQPSGGFHKKNMDGTTLGYTAPEVLRNNPAIQASDVYSLGMTIAEMLTGVPPYQGMEKEDADMHTVMDSSYSEHALVLAIVTDHLRPGLVSVSEREGMPMALIDLVRDMWQHDAAARPSAAQCAARLQKIADAVHVDVAVGPSRAELARKVVSKAEALNGHGSVNGNGATVNGNGVTVNGNGIASEEDVDADVDMDIDVAAGVADVPRVPIYHTPGTLLPGTAVADAANDADAPNGARTVAATVAVAGAPGRAKYNSALPIGVFSTSGRRGADKMEDRHAVEHFQLAKGGELTVCTIFDGHGGKACAHYCNGRIATRVGERLVAAASTSSVSSTSSEGLGSPEGLGCPERAAVMREEFVAADAAFRGGRFADKSGCTAMAAAVWQPEREARPALKRLLLANAGDCRAVLCRVRADGTDEAVRLSRDHHASCPEEQARIRAAGGTIKTTRDGKERVNGHIQVTRALGDAAMKPFGVCADPEVAEFDLDGAGGDDFLILATDGVWDELTDQMAVDAVRKTAKECGLAAKRIGGDAFLLGSTDNITCAVMFLKEFDQHKDVTVMADR